MAKQSAATSITVPIGKKGDAAALADATKRAQKALGGDDVQMVSVNRVDQAGKPHLSTTFRREWDMPDAAPAATPFGGHLAAWRGKPVKAKKAKKKGRR